MIKKKTKMILIVFFIVILLIYLVSHFLSEEKSLSKEEINFNQQFHNKIEGVSLNSEAKTKIATYYEEPVYQEDLENAVAMSKMTNESEQVAIQRHLQLKYLLHLSKEHQITVDEEEVRKDTEETRRKLQSDALALENTNKIIKALGLTEKEFWEKYQPEKTRNYILSIRVQRYMKDNNLPLDQSFQRDQLKMDEPMTKNSMQEQLLKLSDENR